MAFGQKVRSMGRILLLCGAVVGSIGIVALPVLFMLYGEPPSMKSHGTLKCYDQTQKQRPC
jgi:hypothetical protein